MFPIKFYIFLSECTVKKRKAAVNKSMEVLTVTTNHIRIWHAISTSTKLAHIENLTGLSHVSLKERAIRRSDPPLPLVKQAEKQKPPVSTAPPQLHCSSPMSFKKAVYNEKNIPILPNQSAGSTSVPICMAVPCGNKSSLLYFCGCGASNMVKKQV